MARPGEFSSGNHTRWMCGSSFRANTRPLQPFIRSASPAFHVIYFSFSFRLTLIYLASTRTVILALQGNPGFISVVN